MATTNQTEKPTDDEPNPLNRVADPTLTFDVRATPLRLFLRLPYALVDEAKLVVGERETAEWGDDSIVDGLHIRAVDPASVAFVDVTLPAKGGGFGSWDVDGAGETLGVNLGRLQKNVRYARMAGSGVDDDGDPVSVRYGDDLRRLETVITRSSQATQRVSLMNLIDPDSIRQEPDLPGLNLRNVGHPESAKAMKDAVGQLKSTADHVAVRSDPENDDGFQFHAEGDTVTDTVRFLNGYEQDYDGDGLTEKIRGQSSLFSMDYLRNIAKALKSARMDNVTVRWGDEFPAVFQFFNEEYGIRGVFMLAPRITDQ
jgi:proliferating cell nuclear antigen